MYSSQGEKGTESAETCNTAGQSKQETDQAMMLKGNTGYFYCSTEWWLPRGLETDNHSPSMQGGEMSSWDPKL